MTQSPACVLVLDADEATRTLYQRTLSRIWRVLVCATEGEAEQAIRRAPAHAPVNALVVEPATLNDSQWSFLRRISARTNSHTGKPIPIVICSTLDQRRLGAELGVAAYLIKPVSPQLLQETLLDLLRNTNGSHAPSSVAPNPAENSGS